MIFSVLMILLVAGIAYFHYSQGFFTAFLSLVIAAISATVAMGFHEPLVLALAKGKFADQSHAIALCSLYGGTYLILRLAFDKLVPGYVNFGVWPDRIGGATCGLFAALFTAGIVAVAAQSMPFGPSVLGYARYETTGDSKVLVGSVPDWARVGRQDITDLLVKHDELKSPAFAAKDASGLILPVDDFVVGFTSRVSAGALSADTHWSTVHPDYVGELFAQRIGIQPGAKKTAFPLNGVSQLTVESLFLAPKAGYEQIDGDLKDFRGPAAEAPAVKLVPGEGQTLIVARLRIRKDASEIDNHTRFSLGSIRLVSGGKHFFPVAVLTEGPKAVAQRMDDFLVVAADEGADFVFSVDSDSLLGKDAAVDAKVVANAFIEFKRLSRANIGGSELKPADQWTNDVTFTEGILRRKGWPEDKKK